MDVKWGHDNSSKLGGDGDTPANSLITRNSMTAIFSVVPRTRYAVPLNRGPLYHKLDTNITCERGSYQLWYLAAVVGVWRKEEYRIYWVPRHIDNPYRQTDECVFRVYQPM